MAAEMGDGSRRLTEMAGKRGWVLRLSLSTRLALFTLSLFFSLSLCLFSVSLSFYLSISLRLASVSRCYYKHEKHQVEFLAQGTNSSSAAIISSLTRKPFRK